MKTEFRERYESELRTFLHSESEMALLHAYDLGRQAVEGGVGILELTAMHRDGLISALADARGVDAPEAGRRAADFLAEALGPFEMAYLGFREALQRLSRMNETLEAEVERRTHELKDTVRALERADAERSELMGRLVNAQEEERRRIAADIHDDSVQVMAALQIRLALLRPLIEDAEEAGEFDQVQEAVGRSIGRLRHLMFELRPPALDREGLVPALRMYLDEAADEAGFSYELLGELGVEPPPDHRALIYRIAQEVLGNVRKHARATHVTAAVERAEGGIRARISDDGAGFRVEEAIRPRAGHLGLGTVRERARLAGGWARIESEPGSGATVEFWVPDPRE